MKKSLLHNWTHQTTIAYGNLSFFFINIEALGFADRLWPNIYHWTGHSDAKTKTLVVMEYLIRIVLWNRYTIFQLFLVKPHLSLWVMTMTGLFIYLVIAIFLGSNISFQFLNFFRAVVGFDWICALWGSAGLP